MASERIDRFRKGKAAQSNRISHSVYTHLFAAAALLQSELHSSLNALLMAN
jgi:hypothetical protein